MTAQQVQQPTTADSKPVPQIDVAPAEREPARSYESVAGRRKAKSSSAGESCSIIQTILLACILAVVGLDFAIREYRIYKVGEAMREAGEEFREMQRELEEGYPLR